MTFDKTLPGKKLPRGHLHPITQTFNEVVDIFRGMGFETWEARIVDDEYNNFEALNIPQNHPARDLHDTFHVANDDNADGSNLVPITHTSSMQNRIYKSRTPPIASVIAGRCFRPEKLDPTHEHTFYQLEGVYVNENARVSDLIGTLKAFIKRYFEASEGQEEPEVKILPTYFPFVEPGLEFVVKFPSQDQWLELIPSGMIHPKVLEEGGLNPTQWNGFAWAIGIDRLSMLKYGIDDIRWIHSGDLRFVRQF